MFYRLLQFFARLALRIFCSKRTLVGAKHLRAAGPVLVVSNHPDSFLDAIIIGSVFPRPIHFLARGDAFKKPWHAKLLKLLNMIPVYRLSEGKENLPLNECAFRKSKEILSAGGVVLIFIEGISINSNQLQPFKKGAARIALENQDLPGFSVLPVSLAYDSFTAFGKQVNIHVSPPVPAKSFFANTDSARNILHFNANLFHTIDRNILVPKHVYPNRSIEKILLFIPALMGYLLHLPLYAPIRQLVRQKTKGTVFYDSVLFGLLLFLYPLYLLLVFVLFSLFLPSLLLATSVFVLFPILAKCAVVYRKRAR